MAIAVVYSPPLVARPSPQVGVIVRGLKRTEPFSPSFFILSFWEPDTEDKDIQKQPHIQEKSESHHACPGEGPGSEKT